MLSSNDAQVTRDETPGAPRRRGHAAVFGLRAAVLAGLVVATAGGTAAGDFTVQGISDDPVRMVAGGHSTCCPPHAV